MTRFVIAAVFGLSAIVTTGLAVAQHRDGRLTGTGLVIALGGVTSSTVAAGGLAFG